MPTKDEIIEVLKTVEDPELFIDIWFLGLVYHVDIKDNKVYIEMTLTSPMCPMGPQIIHEVQTKVGELEGVEGVDVDVVFDPPWEPSDDVKALLGVI